MKIVKPYAIMKLPHYPHADFGKLDGIQLLKYCEYAARISHRSEDKITDESYDRFIRFIVLEHGDFSVIEHASVSVEAVVNRGITHEWVRHRLGAYTQESTRFVNYGKKIGINLISAFNLEKFNVGSLEDDLEVHYTNTERIYYRMLKEGKSPQQAREVLPHSLSAKILATYNLRMWRHFFLMRTSKETHPQFREVTIPLLKEFQEKIPIIYEDIEPEAKQSDNLRKMR